VFWKIVGKSRWIHPADADISTGKAALDAEDDQWPEQVPRNMLEKLWFWIA
jgi:amino acid transporter